MKDEISKFIEELISKYGYLPKFCHNLNPENEKKLYYSGPLFNKDEISATIETLLFSPWSVNGEKVTEFERKFSNLLGDGFYSVAVNSGSSANLCLISAAKEFFNWKDGDRVIVSAVNFPTTVAPIIQNGMVPSFVDIEMESLNFDLSKLDATDAVAIFVSPVLGNPPDIDRLKEFAEKNNLILLLDGCDSLGSKWDNISLQEYFFASTCSFYPSHHMTTLQGGMISSRNKDFISMVRSYAVWGRSCWCKGASNLLPNGSCGKRFDCWLSNIPDTIIDHKYVFERMGYNLQMLDLQAAIGIEQLKKIDSFHYTRRVYKNIISDLFLKYIKGISSKQFELKKAETSWFGVAFFVDKKEEKVRLIQYLENNGIQTRNYFAGNLLVHKGFEHLGNFQDYPNANLVLDHVFFVGCWPGYTEKHFEYLERVLSYYE